MTPHHQVVCPHCGTIHEEPSLDCALAGIAPVAEGALDPASPLGSSRNPEAGSPADRRLIRGESFRLLAQESAPTAYERDIRFDALRRLISTKSRRALARADSAGPRGTAYVQPVETGYARIAPWIYFVLGLAAVPLFALVPVLESFGALLASTIHEIGHTSVAFLCGMPAAPEISIVGHASAIHSDQSRPMVVMIGLVLAWVAFRFSGRRARWKALALVLVIYPAIALTSAKDLLHLLAGHGAELIFATLCLWNTLDGRLTTFKIDRWFCGTIGWYLVVRHIDLCLGLTRSAEVQALFQHKPLFILTNDYVRAAVSVLGCPLEYLVLGMLIASILVPPAAIVLWSVSRAKRRR